MRGAEIYNTRQWDGTMPEKTTLSSAETTYQGGTNDQWIIFKVAVNLETLQNINTVCT